MNTVSHQETYLPTEEPDQVAAVYDFLAAHEERRGAPPVRQYALVGAEAGDRVELPGEVHRALLQIVEALKAGRAVTVAPQSTMLTTQQAADLLGISRPTVVKLIDRRDLAAEQVGNRRRLRLIDVLNYRERRRTAQYDALADTSVDEETDAEEMLASLRAARREVAARHRSSS